MTYNENNAETSDLHTMNNFAMSHERPMASAEIWNQWGPLPDFGKPQDEIYAMEEDFRAVLQDYPDLDQFDSSSYMSG